MEEENQNLNLLLLSTGMSKIYSYIIPVNNQFNDCKIIKNHVSLMVEKLTCSWV